PAVLSGIDILLLAIVALSTLVGLWRGFVVEVMSLLVWVAAFWLAFVYGEAASRLFQDHVSAASARLLMGYAILFIGALAIGGLATWLIGKLVQTTGLSGTDRLLGLGFGVVRGVALGCVLVLVMGFTPMPGDAWWQHSRVLPGFQRGAEWMRGWLPAQVAQHIRFDGLPASTLPQPGLPGSVLPGSVLPGSVLPGLGLPNLESPRPGSPGQGGAGQDAPAMDATATAGPAPTRPS